VSLKLILSLLSFFILSSSHHKEANLDHETYISITSINLREDKTVEISMELNTSDFIYVFEKETNQKISALSKNNIEYFNDSLVLSFINNHFRIKNNEKDLTLEILGNEVLNDGSFMVYILSKMKQSPKSFLVENNIFIDVFHRQKNMINLSGLINQSITLTKYETSHQFF
tara:strand:+ start:607 stop:1119 length:513 start_codon:yes stop_codon:yes gene_type:complete